MAGVQAKVPKNILITGQPGVGKTTLIQKIHHEFQGRKIDCSGFITEEVRSGGRRIGFDIVTTDGIRDQLARVSQQHSSREFDPSQQRECKVGQYSVNVASFEHVALHALTKQQKSSSSSLPCEKQIFLIDEIGKMELFSHKFMQIVRKLLSQPSTMIVATIPVAKGRPIPFVEEVRNNPQSTVFEVTRGNRDSILGEMLSVVSNSIGIDLNKNR